MIVQQQKQLAELLGVSATAIRKWQTEPGFPDYSAGYDVDAVRAWIQRRDKKGSTQAQQFEQLKLAKLAQQVRKDKANADAAERLEQIAQGNILPRDELTSTVSEIITVARDRLIRVPTVLCKFAPKKYHKRLQDEGTAEVRKILGEFARNLADAVEAGTIND